MSRRRRGRITVQSQPTGAGRFMMRGIGVVHAVFGFVFVVAAITQIIPSAGLFGLPFLVAGGFFCINGIRMAVSKNDIPHRVGYDIETDVQQETIVGLLDDVDKMVEQERASIPATGSSDSYTGLDAKGRMEQLKTLKDAGLITDQEYKQKRQEILNEL